MRVWIGLCKRLVRTHEEMSVASVWNEKVIFFSAYVTAWRWSVVNIYKGFRQHNAQQPRRMNDLLFMLLGEVMAEHSLRLW